MEKLNPEDREILAQVKTIESSPDRMSRVRMLAKQKLALKEIGRIKEQREETKVVPLASDHSDNEKPDKEVAGRKTPAPPPELKRKASPQAEKEPPEAPITKKARAPKASEVFKKIGLGDRMNKSPAFQLYASDFYMDTSGWTCTQVGAYFRLLMSEWVNGSLPNDTEYLARIAQIGHGNFKKLWVPTLKGKFSPDGDGNLVNRRLEEVRQIQEEYRKLQRESGLRGIEAKKKKGIFPFTKSSTLSSDPSSDPPSEIQALQSSSSLLNSTGEI